MLDEWTELKRRSGRRDLYIEHASNNNIIVMNTFNILFCCTMFRHLQRGLKKSNHSFTSAVIRIHAPMEAAALSCVKTLKTSSTAHALWDITADFVKNEQQHLAESSCRKTEGAEPESINCLTQRPRPRTRCSVMPSLKKDSLGRLSNLSAVATKMNFRTKHFLKTIRKISKFLHGAIFVYLCHV